MAHQTASPRLTPQVRRSPGIRGGEARDADTQSQQRPVPRPPAVGGRAWSSRTDGTETQAIAALLHDAAEDQGGEQTLAEIGQKFGADVASIVAECSDTFETPKPPWRARKESYIGHLREASDDAVLVSLADKLDNARAILRDFRAHGNEVWQRFSVQDPQLHLWYYRSLLEVFGQRMPQLDGRRASQGDRRARASDGQSKLDGGTNGSLGRDLCPAQCAAIQAGTGVGSRPEPDRRGRVAGAVGEEPAALGLRHRHR